MPITKKDMLGEFSQKSTKNLSGCVGEKKLWEDEENNMYLKWLIGKNEVLFVVYEFQNFDCQKIGQAQNLKIILTIFFLYSSFLFIKIYNYTFWFTIQQK